EYGASKTGFLIQFWKLHLFCFRLFYFFQLSTNSWFSLIQSCAACCGSFPLLISNMTFSISFSDQWKLSKTLYASGWSSFNPLRTIVWISSALPMAFLGSSRYFKSYLANIQCGVQPVITIGSFFLMA